MFSPLWFPENNKANLGNPLLKDYNLTFKMKLKTYTGLIFFLLTLNSTQATSGKTLSPAPIRAVRVEGPITINGDLDESAWQTEGYSGFRQSEPDDGAPASERTIVWVAYDNDNLYIAARLYDSQPEKIVSRLGRRDDKVESDWFIFAVDPYFDRRSGFQFAVNPSGSIIDGTLFNDEGQDTIWDGIWDSAAGIDEKGWTVEMRIPYHQLHFTEKDAYIWGVNFFRTIKRKNENSAYAWRSREESGYVSRFVQLSGIRDIHPGRLTEMLPFIVGKAHTQPAVPGNPFRTGVEYSRNAGFDLRMALRSNLTLSATVNPDFGQVEVDPAVINISDLETYYTEKRPFFVEGADIFRFGYGGANVVRNLGWSEPSFFYSRRIGRSPQGETSGAGFRLSPPWTSILAAAKLTGKLGDGWNLGFLNAATQREYAQIDEEGQRTSHEIEPFSYYAVLRAQREFLSGFRGLGLMATVMNRDLQTPDLEARLTHNALSIAVDGWTFLDSDRKWVITGWLGGTRINGSEAALNRVQRSSLHYFQRPDASHVEVNPNATSLSGWAGRLYLNKQKGNIVFNTALGAVSPGFNAWDLGYHSRGDAVNGHMEAGYRRLQPGKIFRTWSLTLATHRTYDFGGHRIDENYYFTAQGQWLNYWSSTLFLGYDPPRYNHYLTRGGPMAYYPWGIMRRLNINSDNRRRLVLSLSGYYRTHPYGAYNYSLYIGLRWKPSDNFSLSVRPGYSWRHSVGQYIKQVADPLKKETYGVRYVLSDIIQETVPMEIRINWTFTPKLSLQAYLQPFIGVGDFFLFKELRAARTFDFDYYGKGDSSIVKNENIYTIDPDGPGPAQPFSFPDPDFNLKSLRGTIVLRWEYHQGSTIYLVWTQNRADHAHPGDFQFDRDLKLLFNASGDNIILFKVNYRFTL